MGKTKCKVVPAKVTGPKHTYCQDYFEYRCCNNRLIAVVGDGAGSAQYGARGAQIGCEYIVDHILKNPPPTPRAQGEHWSHWRLESWNEYCVKAIHKARSIVADEAAKAKASLADYHSTLIGVVADPLGGVFFHIGDGAAVATMDEKGERYVVSQPENGEYANETFFFTQDNWDTHLRITYFWAPVIILLATDGVTQFAFARGGKTIAPGFFEPLTRYCQSTQSEQAAKALANSLDGYEPRQLESDDKTILWAHFMRE